MHRFLSGVALSAAFIAGNMAPVLADTTDVNTDGEVTTHSVEVNLGLIEIEGRTLTDAEAANVEGEWAWVAASAAVEVGFKYVECQRPGQNCAWQDYAVAGAKGAATGLIPGGGAARNGVRFFRNGQKINGIRVFVR